MFFYRHILLIITLQLCSPCSIYAINSESVRTIAAQHFEELPNKEIQNPPLLILFSATSGMGKSTIAKQLQDELSAMCMVLDKGRLALKAANLYLMQGSLQKKIICISQYTLYILDDIMRKTPNHTIIIDCSVDRQYKTIQATAALYKIPTFLIRINCSKETAIERIIQREKKDAAEYLAAMNGWWNDYQNFSLAAFDYELDNTTDEPPDLDGLVEAIKQAQNLNV